MNAAQAMRLSAFLRKMDAATVATRGMVFTDNPRGADIPSAAKARSPYADAGRVDLCQCRRHRDDARYCER